MLKTALDRILFLFEERRYFFSSLYKAENLNVIFSLLHPDSHKNQKSQDFLPWLTINTLSEFNHTLKVLEFFPEENINVHLATGETLFHWAVQNDDQSVIENLLVKGVDLMLAHKRTLDLPLHYAIIHSTSKF